MVNERDQFLQVKARVDELMSGGVFGDGIGPSKTAFRINEEFGTSYEGEEIWRIWRQGKPWARPEEDPQEELFCEICGLKGSNNVRVIDGRVCCRSDACTQKILDDIRPDDEVLG